MRVSGGYFAASRNDMKKRLNSAKAPLNRKFESDEGAGELFRKPLCSGCVGSIARGPSGQGRRPRWRSRFATARSRKVADLVAFGPEQIAAAKHIAAAKSVGYQAQLRMWIAEGIRREAKRA